jgi:hypothetical protein
LRVLSVISSKTIYKQISSKKKEKALKMLHSNSSPPLQSLLQRNSSPLKQQSLTMNGANNAQDSYFIFDELSTALPERNGNGGSKILGSNSNNFSNKSSSVGSSIGGSTNTSTATNLSSSTFQRPQYNQQQQRFGFGELLFYEMKKKS